MAFVNGVPEGFEWFDLRSAIENEPAPLDFVLPGFKAGTVGALVSPGGTGKTMLMLQAVAAVASGADLLDLASMDSAWQQTVGPVKFFTAEDPVDVLNVRFRAIGKHLGTAQHEAMYRNLAIAPLLGFGGDIMSAEWRQWIEKETVGARLIVIDTLRRFHQLEENDGGHMSRVLGYMEQLCRMNETSVLFLHHTNKTGGDGQQASRGSSVLTDNVRFQANLIRMESSDAQKLGVDDQLCSHFVRLSFPKLNYSAPIPDKWYRRIEEGVFKPATLERRKRQQFTKPKAVVGQDDENW